MACLILVGGARTLFEFGFGDCDRFRLLLSDGVGVTALSRLSLVAMRKLTFGLVVAARLFCPDFVYSVFASSVW